MKRTTKLSVVAMAVAVVTMSALKAGSALHCEGATSAASDAAKFLLTVENGKPNGNYAAGTLVVVSADVPQAGAAFAGWTGDIAILSNPFLPRRPRPSPTGQ